MDRKTKFTDAEVTAATGLHVDNLRKLITWRALRPVQAGGGRGKVRLWSFPQAMRVAVTAELVYAGFSLQMSHTLTYCLPFDDLLMVYDPAFIAAHVDLEKDSHIREMLDPDRGDLKPNPNMVGSEFIIVNRSAVYTDLLGDSPTLFGFIDEAGNRFFPTFDPKRFLFGMVAESTGVKGRPGIRDVDRKSLLIDQIYFTATRKRLEAFCRSLTEGHETQIDDFEDQGFRNVLSINLNVGLIRAFRRLLGLSVYEPRTEIPNHG